MYRAIGLRTLCTDAELILYQRYWEQFIDYGKFMFIAVVSALVPFFLVYHFSSREAQLIIPSILYFTLYLSINAVCKTHPYQLMVPILKKMVRR